MAGYYCCCDIILWLGCLIMCKHWSLEPWKQILKTSSMHPKHWEFGAWSIYLILVYDSWRLKWINNFDPVIATFMLLAAALPFEFHNPLKSHGFHKLLQAFPMWCTMLWLGWESQTDFTWRCTCILARSLTVMLHLQFFDEDILFIFLYAVDLLYNFDFVFNITYS